MKSILFIDDDRFVTTLYKAKLQNEGFAVDVAHSANEAFEQLEHKKHPDIIVLDLNMPGINGVIILKTIRSVPQLQHIPVIIFSSGYVKALVDEASQLGIYKFFAKAQCPPKMLISAITEILSKMAIPASALTADADTASGSLTADDLPALLYMFVASEDPDALRSTLLKIYKASRDCINKALAADESTAQGKLSRMVEKLFEDLYAHPEHITASTKHTLAAGLQKLSDIEAENAGPILDSELALKDILRTLETQSA
ncbi:MAG TPA: response regulator [Pontiellaceae bacterium]|nr:response regulator [Pontiellaceae bacterium]HPR83326.1 response regulator [Pontiellaceae bacterium]